MMVAKIDQGDVLGDKDPGTGNLRRDPYPEPDVKALRKHMQEHCGVSDPRDCVDCRCVEDGCCAA